MRRSHKTHRGHLVRFPARPPRSAHDRCHRHTIDTIALASIDLPSCSIGAMHSPRCSRFEPSSPTFPHYFAHFHGCLASNAKRVSYLYGQLFQQLEESNVPRHQHFGQDALDLLDCEFLTLDDSFSLSWSAVALTEISANLAGKRIEVSSQDNAE